ncbi:uncharacterized protein LOC132315086 [Cornus florida]|uniref:uncharacterized protein LOC132315086 n=1 Tax=Cornus florida TaxID=4283 RepID=UPI00289F8922|nr:uncharacterized protein LOC132315086 [Cornus florida]
MDLESSPLKVNEKSVDGPCSSPKRMSRRRKICLLVTFGVILAVVLLIVILALTVFKPKDPVITVNPVSLENLDFSLDALNGRRVYLNVTVDVSLSVKNPNKVGFNYRNSSASLKYMGELVGEVPIPAGKISADKTKPMNVSVTVLADRLLTNSNAYSDVLSGTLPLSASTRISGKVRILNFIKIGVVAYATCDFTINVMTITVADQTCDYKTKL